MKIGIIGGSISGCSAAILLLKEGHNVSVFERSKKDLVGRGGGIGTTADLLEQINKDGLLKKDFAHFQINKMPFVGKNPDYEPFGKTAWEMPMNFKVFQWNELWKNLRSNVPDALYNSGIKVTEAKTLSSGLVRLISDSGSEYDFDMVLFADGYNSLGRRILFPDKKLKYRGYVLWRGLINESKLKSESPLKDEILRLSYIRKPGHNVVYFIPNQEGSIKKGERVVNWAAYIEVALNELDELMTDKNGKVRQGTLPPGEMTDKNEKKLKQFLKKHVPKHFADIVNNTENSYLQVIYTLDLDNYYKDRICLIGDAGIVVQPFTGSGVFKGYNNVKDLISSIKTHDTLDDALQEWNEKQLKTGKRLLALGEQMEKAFIWEQPDFSNINEEEASIWWKESVSFPEEFNYNRR